MRTIPHMTSLIGMKVRHGSPGYENLEVIKDVMFDSAQKAIVIFESEYTTNMSIFEFDTFLEEGEVSYLQRFGSDSDVGQTVLKLAEY